VWRSHSGPSDCSRRRYCNEEVPLPSPIAEERTRCSSNGGLEREFQDALIRSTSSAVPAKPARPRCGRECATPEMKLSIAQTLYSKFKGLFVRGTRALATRFTRRRWSFPYSWLGYTPQSGLIQARSESPRCGALDSKDVVTSRTIGVFSSKSFSLDRTAVAPVRFRRLTLRNPHRVRRSGRSARCMRTSGHVLATTCSRLSKSRMLSAAGNRNGHHYSDHTSSVILPTWLADQVAGYVTPLLRNAYVYGESPEYRKLDRQSGTGR